MIRLKGSTLDHTIIEKHEVTDVWNDVKDLVAKTNDDVLNEKDILEYLKAGHFILWIGTETDSDNILFAMTLHFAYYPKHKMCRVATIAGERMKDWVDETLLELENWAKAQGCDYMDMYARRGWKKILKEYKEDCILLRKKL